MTPRPKSSEASIAKRRIEHLRFVGLSEQRISEVLCVSREFVRQHLLKLQAGGG